MFGIRYRMLSNWRSLMRGSELGAWRKSLGLTQADAGQKLGVTRATIQNWESEATPIPGAVETGCKIWEQEFKKRPDFGPVTLIYSDGPMFVNPYGPNRLAMMQRELYPSNAEALERIYDLWGKEDFHSPLIMEESGEIVWNVVELSRKVAEVAGTRFLVEIIALPLPGAPLSEGPARRRSGPDVRPPRSFSSVETALAHARALVQEGYRVEITGPRGFHLDNDQVRARLNVGA
jgi:DNA-binding XRE family transcriptional regulator